MCLCMPKHCLWLLCHTPSCVWCVSGHPANVCVCVCVCVWGGRGFTYIMSQMVCSSIEYLFVTCFGSRFVQQQKPVKWADQMYKSIFPPYFYQWTAHTVTDLNNIFFPSATKDFLETLHRSQRRLAAVRVNVLQQGVEGGRRGKGSDVFWLLRMCSI